MPARRTRARRASHGHFTGQPGARPAAARTNFVTTYSSTFLEPGSAFQRVRHVLGDRTLGWGVIGASARASKHVIPAIRAQPPLPEPGVRYPVTDSHIVGVFSRDVARARRFADDMQLPHAFVNLTDMLEREDIHCIYVGGHPRHHAQATLAALAAGKHVLCEPPMALSADDATAMAHTAGGAGLQLAVNYSRRADPAVQAMRQLLMEREIGDMLGGRAVNMHLLRLSLHTWRLQPNGGGAALNCSIHDIDLLRFMLRDEIAAVYARRGPRVLGSGPTGVEEDIVTQVEMRRNGRIIELHDSFLIPHHASRMEIYGSAGTLIVRHCFSDERNSELSLLRNERETVLPVEYVHAERESIARFNSAVRGQGQPLAGAGDGQNNLSATLAILESIENGRRVLLPYGPRPPEDRSVL